MKSWKLGGMAALLIAAGFIWWQQSDNVADAGNAPQAGADSAAQGRGGATGRGAPPAALVVARPVVNATINDRLQAIGNGKALASVSVVPLSGGLLTDILVRSGQRVAKNDVLALLDDDVQLIARDRAARTAENAAVDEARLAKLYRTRTTTEAELIRTRADLADAELALREAELTLARRSIKAPIAGIVGLTTVDSGNYVTTQSEIVTIDDRSTIIVEFWVPERFASQIAVGQEVRATAQANPSRNHAGLITAIGSRVESDSRTLPIEAQLDNQNDSLRPGMSFNLTLNFAGQNYPAVDPLAVQWDSTGSFVWRLVDNKVERMPVQIIQRNPESVLVASELVAGDQVITEGLLSLRAGAEVRVQGGAGKRPPDERKKPEIESEASTTAARP
ncbi:efflux RND transporter periplasmic adaptor subunit [Granulosicoccus antarcticus]|uniref:Multidrug resistance protein MdtA n=1 Tax=Granulosicoccus antarcticus IMCC3135 TaxID=1192854 RepID=A0A2Z2NNN0_9GAMM|nr:efflux RND transporter periplasmic adaptor subunit [Granulosicoccus antarcticus]ASJ71541.1 Multidrug resistance protein MdtA [Granulosicoccus antarcticus IMCC3135]